MSTAARAGPAAARTLARNWQECSIHVKISPRPQNLAESRQVLRVLQQYGEVIMYRHLKTAAHDAINASPIRFCLERGENGWTSRISQDASLEGLDVEPSHVNGEKESDNLDEPSQHPSTSGSDLYDENEVPRGELLSYDRYSHEEAAVLDAPALISPEQKWGRFFEALERKSGPSQGPKDTSKETSSEPPKTLQSGSIKKRNKRRALSIAEELAAHIQASPSRQEKKDSPMSPVPEKEFELTIAQSLFNHQAYIERQGYYAGFNPDMKTIMAADLKGRVPLEGLADCRLSKTDVPLRQRLLKKERARPRQTLREMWEAGRKSRGEV
ncbi:MAG: hypothetical protein LQ352_004629 [Teloschistes flavicans]|nr:MAG: hypothetical protein LQ352_004629 [Teloschistes flavicans]